VPTGVQVHLLERSSWCHGAPADHVHADRPETTIPDRSPVKRTCRLALDLRDGWTCNRRYRRAESQSFAIPALRAYASHSCTQPVSLFIGSCLQCRFVSHRRAPPCQLYRSTDSRPLDLPALSIRH
jgi:hypothetical protein